MRRYSRKRSTAASPPAYAGAAATVAVARAAARRRHSEALHAMRRRTSAAGTRPVRARALDRREALCTLTTSETGSGGMVFLRVANAQLVCAALRRASDEPAGDQTFASQEAQPPLRGRHADTTFCGSTWQYRRAASSCGWQCSRPAPPAARRARGRSWPAQPWLTQ